MMIRTGALLLLAAGAWTVGGAIALRGHWHPFSHGHSSARSEYADVRIHAVAPGRAVVRVGPARVRLTERDRVRLRRGYPAERPEAVGALPAHVHAPGPAVIHARPARRSVR